MRKINLNLIIKRAGYVFAILSSISTLIGALAPANIGEARTAFALTFLRHALPESIIILALSLLALLPLRYKSHAHSALMLWRSAFGAGVLCGRWWGRTAAIAPLLIVFAGLCGSIYFFKDYARARYAYWFKEGLQHDFQTEQLNQAFQYEIEYRYEKAADKYVALQEMFPASKNVGLLKERLSLNRGLLTYAERMYNMGKLEESQHGISRLALNLYLESLRTNPRQVESQKRLEHIRQHINDQLNAATPLVDTCYVRGSAAASQRSAPTVELLSFLMDLPQQDKNGTTRSFDLCTVALRFPSSSAFFDTVKRSWQLNRLSATTDFSKSVMDGKTMVDLLGKDDDRKMKSLEVPLPISQFSPAAEQNTLQADLLLPPLPQPAMRKH